jgi:hypothetical protein
MPFNLLVTRPNGSTYRTLNSPYPTREETGCSVRIIVMPNLDDDQARALAAAVIAAPLGETVAHPLFGATFRTEEI